MRSRDAQSPGPGTESPAETHGAELAEAVESLRPVLTAEGTIRFLLVASKALTSGLEPADLTPLIEQGLADLVIASPSIVDADLGLSGGDGGRRPIRDPKESEGRGLVLVHDAPLEKRLLLYPRHFLAQIMTAASFQKVTSAATILRLVGHYLKERDRLLDRPSGLLVAAEDAGVPVFVPDLMNSVFGNVVAGQVLAGNRLGQDPGLDLNELASFLLETRRPDVGCLLISLGGGKPLRFTLRAFRYLKDTLGIRDARCQTAFIAGDPDAERFLTDPFLAGETAESLEGADGSVNAGERSGDDAAVCVPRLQTVPCGAPEAVRTLTRLAGEVGKKEPKRLEDQREEFLERLRRAHVEATTLKHWPPIKVKFPGRG